MIKNCQKWVYIGMGGFFPLKLKKLAQRAAKHTTNGFSFSRDLPRPRNQRIM